MGNILRTLETRWFALEKTASGDISSFLTLYFKMKALREKAIGIRLFIHL